MTKVGTAAGAAGRVLVAVLGVGLGFFWGGRGIGGARAAERAEPPVGGAGTDGAYLRHVHERIHPCWADAFIRMSPYKVLGPETSTKQVEILIDVRWDGTLERMEVAASSGAREFDAAAMNAVLTAAPFPPPVDALADDGLAHLRWTFARDFRLCAGARIVPVEYPLESALPNLAARGRLGEAVRRMTGVLEEKGLGPRNGAGGDFLSPFARQWLSRPSLNSELDTRAAIALALAGDLSQVRRIEAALLRPLTAAVAAEALDRLGADVGTLLGKGLDGAAGAAAPDTREAALIALLAVPAAAQACAPCAAVLAAAALDTRKPLPSRLAAIAILGQIAHPAAGRGERGDVAARALATAAAEDQPPAIRGAALLAAMPRGRGRPGVIRMAELLHDRLPEIRAAAAAGVLRAGGDSGLDQLYLLGREKDPRPLVAAAGELGRLDSEASAVLLGKILRRTDPAVRVAAVRALMGRHDPAARALVDPVIAGARVNAAEDVNVRLLAVEGAAPAELAAMAGLTGGTETGAGAGAGDRRLGRAAYRALLAGGHRVEAARWLLRSLEGLSQEERLGVLGEWIAVARERLAAGGKR